MKRDELLLGAVIYGLIIAAGYAGPILKKLGAFPWDKPVGAFAADFFRALDQDAPQPAPKALAAKVQRLLSPSEGESKPDLPLEAVHRKLEENWKRMASPHWMGPETGPSPAARSFAGKKSGSQPTPGPPEKKAFDEEPTKG